jgi:hypothetical protein
MCCSPSCYQWVNSLRNYLVLLLSPKGSTHWESLWSCSVPPLVSVWDIPIRKPNKLNLKVQAAPEVFGIICISENHLDIQNWKVIFLIRSGNGWGFSPDIPVYTLSMIVGWLMVFNAIFNYISVISWGSVLLVEETRVPGEKHRPVASHWQTLNMLLCDV